MSTESSLQFRDLSNFFTPRSTKIVHNIKCPTVYSTWSLLSQTQPH